MIYKDAPNYARRVYTSRSFALRSLKENAEKVKEGQEVCSQSGLMCPDPEALKAGRVDCTKFPKCFE